MKKITLLFLTVISSCFLGFSQGQTCANPIVIGSLPYNITDDTSNYGDDYDTIDRPALGGEQYTNGTGSASYLTGDDAVYAITPSTSGVYNFDLSNTLDDWIGFWLFEGCPFTSIVARHTATSGTTRSLPGIQLTAGTTYYVVISTWAAPQSTPYTLDISQVTCPTPTGMMATNITTTSADLTWTPGGSETTWIIQVGPPGFTPGVDTPIVSYTGWMALTAPASGLTPGTTYEAYVQADCGGGDTSDWSGPPVVFTTLCEAFIPDYTESFDTFVPDCWEEAGSGTPATGPSDFGSGAWLADGWLNTGTTDDAVNINLFSTGKEEWLISPQFDLTAGGYELVYDVALTDYNNSNPPEGNGMGVDDEVQVLISDDGGASWTVITTYNQSSYPSSTGDQEIFDLSAYDGATVQFAFWATEGTTNDLEDYDFFIDNFIVRTPLACTSAVVDSSTISEDCGNSQFYIAIDITTVGDATQISDGTNAYVISGTGILQVGPFASGDSPTLTVEHSDSACDFSLGTFSFNCPPANDLLANAIAINCGDDVTGTTIGATQDESDAPDVATVETDTSADNDSPWVWYSFTGSGSSETLQLSTCGTAQTDFDTEIFVYTGTSGALTLIDDGYDECGGSTENWAAETTFTSDGTTTYYIAIGGYDSDDIGNFHLSVSCTLSINDDTLESMFSYYPNPVNNTLTLKAQKSIENVSVVNMLGQEVLRVAPNSVNDELDMSGLSNGSYFVKVTVEGLTKTVRVIKQ